MGTDKDWERWGATDPYFGVLSCDRFRKNRLADRVEPGGYLAVHFIISSSAPKLVRAAVRLRYALPPLHWLRNLIKRRPIFEPAMQLHIYNFDTVFGYLKSRKFDTPIGCSESDMDGV